MVQPVECRCKVAAINVGGVDVCPLCGAKRNKRIPRPAVAVEQRNPNPPLPPLRPPTPPIPRSDPKPLPNNSAIRQQQPLSVSPNNQSENVVGRHLAAITHRGIVHQSNQDAFSIIEIGMGFQKSQIIVVCDGVSSAQHAELASKKGAAAAADSLVRLLNARVDVKDAMRLSIVVADMALRKIPFEPKSNMHPPGATIVAAVFSKGWLTVGWIGDSRCYWIDSSGTRLLTKDHSWINMVVDTGTITQQAAERQPEAHRIFRCIGPIFELKSNDEQPVEVIHVRLTGPGRVLVCTDGLWNYLPNPETLSRLVAVGAGAPDARSQAQNLINYACTQGGKDNITAAVLAVD